MGRVQSQSLRNTIITYLGTGLGFVNLILLFPRFLGPEELGLVNLLPQIAVLFAQVSSLGFGGTIIRFFPYFRDRRRQHHGFLFLIFGQTLAGFLLVLLIFVLLEPLVIKVYSKDSALLVQYYLYIIPLALFALWHLLLENYLSVLYKTVVPSFVRALGLRLGNTMIISLFALDVIGLLDFVRLMIVNNGLAVVGLLAYSLYLRQFPIRPRLTFRIKRLWRQMTVYGSAIFLNTVGATIYRLIDSLMLAALMDLNAVGIYTTMLFVLEVTVIPTRSMYKLVNPMVGELWKKRDMEGMGKLYRQVSIVNLVFGGFVLMGIVINLHNILGLLEPRFQAGLGVIFILGAARLMTLATGINYMILTTSRYYVVNLLFLVLLMLMAVATNFVLIPRYGLSGAALATAASSITLDFLVMMFVRAKFELFPWTRSTVVILFVILGVSVVGWAIPRVPFWPVDLLLRSSIATILYWVLVLKLHISVDVTDYVAKMLGRVGLGRLMRYLA